MFFLSGNALIVKFGLKIAVPVQHEAMGSIIRKTFYGNPRQRPVPSGPVVEKAAALIRTNADEDANKTESYQHNPQNTVVISSHCTQDKNGKRKMNDTVAKTFQKTTANGERDSTDLPEPETIYGALSRMPCGGSILTDGKIVPVSSTCAFDNVVFLLYALVTTSPPVRDYMTSLSDVGVQSATQFLDVIRRLNDLDFLGARTLIATQLVCSLQTAHVDESGEVRFSFFGSEEIIMSCVNNMTNVVEHRSCPNSDCNAPKKHVVALGSDQWNIESPDTLAVILNNGLEDDCVGTVDGHKCTARVIISFEFIGSPPPFIAYCMPASRSPREDSLTTLYNLRGQMYRLFGYTLNLGNENHYVEIGRAHV